MKRDELKLRQRLAAAKGGHKKVLQGRLDAMLAKRGEEKPVEVAATKKTTKKAAKKAAKKTTKKKDSN